MSIDGWINAVVLSPVPGEAVLDSTEAVKLDCISAAPLSKVRHRHEDPTLNAEECGEMNRIITTACENLRQTGETSQRNRFFVSHYQANGSDPARILHDLLKPHGGCWYDQTAVAQGDQITLTGMVDYRDANLILHNS